MKSCNMDDDALVGDGMGLMRMSLASTDRSVDSRQKYNGI